MFHRNVNILMSTLEIKIRPVQNSFKDIKVEYIENIENVHFLTRVCQTFNVVTS